MLQKRNPQVKKYDRYGDSLGLFFCMQLKLERILDGETARHSKRYESLTTSVEYFSNDHQRNVAAMICLGVGLKKLVYEWQSRRSLNDKRRRNERMQVFV